MKSAAQDGAQTAPGAARRRDGTASSASSATRRTPSRCPAFRSRSSAPSRSSTPTSTAATSSTCRAARTRSRWRCTATRTSSLPSTRAQSHHHVDVGLTMSRFAETVTVTAEAVDVATSSAEAQLIERKQSQVITDNIGSQEMKANGDSDAAAAMSRVTGLSVVDNQYVFVRGLGERYSNTTLAGSVLPTTEPDKKVVPLDLFPTGLIDSVQVSKSYSPDRSAEFAGGLVQIVPMKLPSQPVARLLLRRQLLLERDRQERFRSARSASRDVLGLRQRRARAAGRTFPNNKIVRQGIYTPDVGYTADADHRVRPAARQPVAAGQRPGHARAELERGVRQPLRQARRRRQRDALLQGAVRRGGSALLPHRRRGRARGGQRLPHADRHAEGAARRRRQPRPTSSRRATGCRSRTSTRTAAATKAASSRASNLDNARDYRNNRLQFIEEGLIVERRRRRALLPGPGQQPHRLARQLRARDARRAGPARDALRAR